MTKKQQNPPSWNPKVRRKRYKDDPEYRQRAIQSTRRSYRGKFGRLDTSTCLDNLGGLGRMGTKRAVDVGGRTTTRITFTTEELAVALNRRVEVVYRWVRKGIFPTPAFRLCGAHNQHDNVYLYQEARAILHVMGEHQRNTSYYRVDHVDTRKRLFNAVNEVAAKV